MSNLTITRANTILYCQQWQQTVDFYRTTLGLTIAFENDWFIEFQLSANAFLSIANQERASIKSAGGQGITITLCVENLEQTWEHLHRQKATPAAIKQHAWGGKAFFIYDPEGHRLEFWSKHF